MRVHRQLGHFGPLHAFIGLVCGMPCLATGCARYDAIMPLLLMAADYRLDVAGCDAVEYVEGEGAAHVARLACRDAKYLVMLAWYPAGWDGDGGFVLLCHDGHGVRAVRSIEVWQPGHVFVKERFEVIRSCEIRCGPERVVELVEKAKALSPHYPRARIADGGHSMLIYCVGPGGATVSSAFGIVEEYYELARGCVPDYWSASEADVVRPFAEMLYQILQCVKPLVLYETYQSDEAIRLGEHRGPGNTER